MQPGDSPFSVAGDGEDCLYLDVHAPKSASGPLPVMVWIHGGAFTTGGSAAYVDPAPLMAEGAIVVAMNYRLGALGFLGHPAFAAADGSVGNYGMMDQQAALRWVKDNIAAFGGDPENVTIFGESAGGFSVLTHLASPTSAGLFHKAIIQSGAYGIQTQLTREQLKGRSTEVVQKAIASAGAEAGCTSDTGTAECLRAMPAEALRTHLFPAFAANGYNPVPSVDGKVLRASVKETFAAGENNRVPVINGSNENEWSLFLAMGEMAPRAAANNWDASDTQYLMKPQAYPFAAAAFAQGSGVNPAELATEHYPLSAFGADRSLQPSLAASAIGTAFVFACNGLRVSQRMAAQGAPVWMYEFRDQTAPPLVGRRNGAYPLAMPQGAAHAAELQYLFGFQPLDTADQKALSRTMAQYWVNFARTGDPNRNGVPAWPGVAQGSLQALDVAADGGVAPMPLAAFAAHTSATRSGRG
jgi:para-nitrobenzyl esterase